jgi:hypothetical protein
MKPLDEYIRSNPEKFDRDEPLDGHFDRFEKKLDRLNFPMQKKHTGLLMLRIAAAVLVISLITFGALMEFRTFSKRADRVFAAEFPELNEAENYYTVQLNQYYSKLERLGFNDDKNEKKQILNELSDMDRQVRVMKRDLIQNPDDERIVHAIINFYQTKLELMDMIISRTQEYNNTIL